MKLLTSFALILTSFLFAACADAQAVDTTVCEILANPQSFDGKIVRLKGTVIAGFDEFVIKDPSCNQSVNAIWLSYPEGTKAKAGPVALLQMQLSHNNSAPAQEINRAAVKLEKNNDFKQFDSFLSTPYKTGGMCLGCVRYTVSATLVGRLEGAKDVGLTRDSSGKIIAVNGFGNLNQYHARLVLQSVSGVSSQEIDFSKVSTATKGDSVRDSAGGDPISAAHQVARGLGPGSSAADQLEQAAAAYGKEGEDNGVEVGFGTPNEISDHDKPKGNSNSPDGVLFNCTFDMDRLKGEALTRAISHVGTHIVDIRGPQPASASSLYATEFHAWQTTVLSALATRQNTLTLPGAYLAWNAAWPAGDRSKMVEDAISKYLTEWDDLKN
jgi:hypothetical protein